MNNFLTKLRSNVMYNHFIWEGRQHQMTTFCIWSWFLNVWCFMKLLRSEGTSKLVEFTSTFQTSQTFINLRIICSNQANSLSFSLWYKRQIIQKMNIRVSQIVKLFICWPLPLLGPPCLYFTHIENKLLFVMFKGRCWRHVIDLNHLLTVVSMESSYMQKLFYIPNMFRSDEHCLSWLVS
jgi:hypothetical protein